MVSAEPSQVAVVLHDVAPATQPQCEALIALTQTLGVRVPLTLLVVPRFHGGTAIDEDSAFRRFIDARVAAGDELALHGYTHRDDQPVPKTPAGWLSRRLLTAGEGEFSALSADEARRRLEAGLGLFRICDWRAAGFVPPAWQISTEALGEVAKLREFFSYTSRQSQVQWLASGERVAIPSLCYSARSAPRRALSLLWNDRLLSRHAAAPAMRVALHPIDAQFEGMMAGWGRMLRRLLHTRTAVTKAELIQNVISRCATSDQSHPGEIASHRLPAA